jgi:hypothetical protein
MIANLQAEIWTLEPSNPTRSVNHLAMMFRGSLVKEDDNITAFWEKLTVL